MQGSAGKLSVPTIFFLSRALHSIRSTREKFKMRVLDLWMKVGAVAIVVLFIASLSTGHAYSAANPKPSPCVAPEYRQFDFWIGDWDAFEADGGAKVARTRVDSILDSCVLLEIYEGTDGHKGESLTIYDVTRKSWHQTWVTNLGQLLVIEGKMQGGEMVLRGVDHGTGGEERLVQGTWKPENGGVREVAVVSTDGGKVWKPWFDLVFRPHHSAP
ncbi:MAG TPA: hypothetical protein VI488_12850 [Candidatus Angelobacter sp.]